MSLLSSSSSSSNVATFGSSSSSSGIATLGSSRSATLYGLARPRRLLQRKACWKCGNKVGRSARPAIDDECYRSGCHQLACDECAIELLEFEGETLRFCSWKCIHLYAKDFIDEEMKEAQESKDEGLDRDVELVVDPDKDKDKDNQPMDHSDT